MSPENKKFIMAGAAIAILLSVLAPFLASPNPDGLDKNIIELVGGGSEEKAEEFVEEKVHKYNVAYEAPFSDYSIAGMEKAGEVLAILIGTIIMLVLGLGVSSLMRKKKESQP